MIVWLKIWRFLAESNKSALGFTFFVSATSCLVHKGTSSFLQTFVGTWVSRHGVIQCQNIAAQNVSKLCRLNITISYSKISTCYQPIIRSIQHCTGFSFHLILSPRFMLACETCHDILMENHDSVDDILKFSTILTCLQSSLVISMQTSRSTSSVSSWQTLEECWCWLYVLETLLMSLT